MDDENVMVCRYCNLVYDRREFPGIRICDQCDKILQFNVKECNLALTCMLYS